MAIGTSPIPIKNEVGRALESDIQKINGVDVPGSNGYMPTDLLAVNGTATTNGIPIDDSTPIEFDIKLVDGAATTNGLPIDDSTPIEMDITLFNGSSVANGMPIDDTTPISVTLSGVSGTPGDQTGVNAVQDGATQANAYEYFQVSTTFLTGVTAKAESVQVSFGRGCQFILVKNLRTAGADVRVPIRHGDVGQAGGTVLIPIEVSTSLRELAGDTTNPSYFEVGVKNRDKNDEDEMTYNFEWTT